MSQSGWKSPSPPNLPASAGLLLCAVALVGLAGCRGGGDAEPVVKKQGSLFGKVFSGKNKKGKEADAGEGAAKKKKAAQPRQIPIGVVHLVNRGAHFVLIKSSRTSAVPEGADLFSYTAAGIPSGKLKLSPERKGAFLVADIIEGNPQSNEVVMFFGIEGADGELAADYDPDAPQVLE